MKTLNVTYVKDVGIVTEYSVKNIERERNSALFAIEQIRRGSNKVFYFCKIPSFMTVVINEAYRNGYHVLVENLTRKAKDINNTMAPIDPNIGYLYTARM